MSDPINVSLVSAVTDDGVRLHGAIAGRSGAGGILGVHGAWGNFYATPIAEFLRHAPRRGLLALSLNGRGHDLGGMDDGARSIGIMRERIETAPQDLEAARALLVNAGADRYVVVGHSYGCARATYWLSTIRPIGCVGAVLMTPPPTLASTAPFFVDGSFEEHVAAARDAVAAGDPERLITMRSHGRIPMIAEAATLLSIWAPESQSRCDLHLPALPMPILVLVGEREPRAYRAEAEKAAEVGNDTTLIVMEGEGHYYQRNRPRLAAVVLDWIERRGLLPGAPADH